jgi:hypothetical protein
VHIRPGGGERVLVGDDDRAPGSEKGFKNLRRLSADAWVNREKPGIAGGAESSLEQVIGDAHGLNIYSA